MFRQVQVLTFPLVFSLLTINGFSEQNKKTREITVTYNKGCDIDECFGKEGSGDFNNTVYITADGTNDRLHYLWSTIGAPSLLMLNSSKDVTLTINWTQLLLSQDVTGSVVFEPKESIQHSMLVLFSRLIEYNDENDKADISQSPGPMRSIPLSSCDWNNVSDLSSASDNQFQFQTFSLPNNNGNGTFSLNAIIFDETKRDKSLPHMAYTDNSTQFSVELKKLSTNYTNSRFALEMYVVHEDNSNDYSTAFSLSHSLDDEYTPGVFETCIFELKRVGAAVMWYLQWKPVSYNSEERSFKSAVLSKSSQNLSSSIPVDFANSLGGAFYKDLSKLEFARFNISFGSTKDGFYKATKYISWTSLVGFGDYPEDKISMLVIIIISVGLGIPVLIVLAGGTFICFKNNYKGS